MNLVVKIVISLLVAAAASALLHFLPAVPVTAVLFAATIATALLVSIPTGGETASSERPRAESPAPQAAASAMPCWKRRAG